MVIVMAMTNDLVAMAMTEAARTHGTVDGTFTNAEFALVFGRNARSRIKLDDMMVSAILSGRFDVVQLDGETWRIVQTSRWIDLLLALGLVNLHRDGTIRWPVSFSWSMCAYCWRTKDYAGFFRNRPEVVKWRRGRLLPRRWGFYILGLEIGDRG